MLTKPTLVIVCGHFGVGKSSLGKRISQDIHAVYLDKDTFAKPFVEKMIQTHKPNTSKEDRVSAYYMNELRCLEYRGAIAVATENLLIGNNVVLVAPFLKELTDSDWLYNNIIEPYGLTNKICIKLIIVETDERSIKERIALRGDSKDKHRLVEWSKYKDTYYKIESSWSVPTYIFNNNNETGQPYFLKVSKLNKWIRL